MKNIASVIIALLALFVALFAFFKLNEQKKLTEQLQAQINQDKEPEAAEELELAVYMQRLQWFSNKLYFAGTAGNAELAEFYLHEIEETMETIVNGNPMEDGKPIVDHVRTYGLEEAERFYSHVQNHGLSEFKDKYTSLINSCNSCHVVVDHSFIKIQEPLSPIADNQNYGL
jgi:hypothetical protein